ncbi:MAG: penicillin-binding protein 2 [Acidobacteriota bacterium]
MKINRGERRRALIVFGFFLVWVLLTVGALVKTQVFNYSKYLSKIKNQSSRIFSLHPKRGTIYDANGDILAISISSKSAFLTNKNKNQSMKIYKSVIGKIYLNTREKLKIRKRIYAGKNFIWIKRKLTENDYNALSSIKRKGDISKLEFIDEYKRIYPQKKIASHVLGGVGVDEQGLSGIEFSLGSVIKGKGGKVDVQLDARNQIFKLEYLEKKIPGKNLYLTLDSTIQYFVEKRLEETIKKYKAKGGAVIVMDSKKGSILAMASFPNYDPARIKYISPGILKNNAISFLYYPGSTFKVILATSAIENKACGTGQIFNCYNGVYQINDLKIYDVHSYDKLSFKDVIIYSSNIGAAKIGEKLGEKKYYRDIKKFGFGKTMNLRLPAKERGILNPVEKWSNSSVAYLAHGYEIFVTPLQMIRAFNVIASGGFLVEPRILESINGVRFKNMGKKRIISRSTAKKIANIMSDVVKVGTGKKAAVEDIRIAGKTGTAKKYRKGKFRKLYVSSFGGFFPAEDPEITMFVVINEPVGAYYGGDVAAPLFREISKRLIINLNISSKEEKLRAVRL